MVVTRWFTGGEKHPQTAATLPVRLAMSCCRWAAHKKPRGRNTCFSHGVCR